MEWTVYILVMFSDVFILIGALMLVGIALFIGIVILCLAAFISWEDTR